MKKKHLLLAFILVSISSFGLVVAQDNTSEKSWLQELEKSLIKGENFPEKLSSTKLTGIYFNGSVVRPLQAF